MSCLIRVARDSRRPTGSSATRQIVGLAFGALVATAACQPSPTVDSGISCATDADCSDSAADVGATNDAFENDVVRVAPTIDNFTPITQGAGGEVTITGSNLASPLHVTFGGGPDARITASSATSITAIVPVGSASGSVAVTTDGGLGSLPGFIYSNVISCAGFTRTFVETFPWVADSGINPTGNVGTGLMRDMAYVGIINVPAAAPSSPSSSGRISVAEYFDAPHRRWATISTSPCTWGTPGDGFTQYTIEPTFYFTIGPNTTSQIPMTAGTTYYLNVQMTDPVTMANQCGTGSCNLIAEFFKPPGT